MSQYFETGGQLPTFNNYGRLDCNALPAVLQIFYLPVDSTEETLGYSTKC